MSALLAYDNLNINEHTVCGLVDDSLGVLGDRAGGKTNVKLSETLRILERMPICVQQVGPVWQRGLISSCIMP